MSNREKLNGYSRGGGGDTGRGPGGVLGPSGPLGTGVGVEEDGVPSADHHQGVSDSPKKDFPALNPFIHELHLSTLEKIQVAIMTVTLVPIRLILIGVCLVFAWFFAYISLLGRSKEDETRPVTGWRRSIRPIAVFFARGLFFAGGFHWVTVRGKRATSAEAPILATAPHSSYMDALSVTYLGLTSVVAKTETEDVPFFGTLTKFTQPVFVLREDPCSRQNTIREIQRRAASGGEWPQIIIFTEGTCTNRSCLINFKQGAFVPGVPVQPVCIKYKNRLDSYTWTWKGPSAYKVLWLTLCQFHSGVEIEFLPVYVPSDAEKKDVRLFGRNVRALMSRSLGIPTTENAFEDGQAMVNAMRLGLPRAEDLVHINRIVRQLSIGTNDLKLRLPSLCAAAQSSAPSVTLDELAVHLQSQPSSQPLQELFAFYLKTDENVVDLRKYVIILYLLTLPRFVDDFLEFCFNAYDHGQKGFLTVSELTDLLVALDLPRSPVDLLKTSVDGSTNQISFEIFKSTAEKLPEYSALFDHLRSSDRKRHDRSGSNAGKAKSE